MINTKDKVNFEDLKDVHPNLLVLLVYAYQYARRYELPFTITSIKDRFSGRISKSHEEGRAIDLSVKAWPEFHILRLTKKMNEEFESIGAISKSDGISRACVYHKVEGNAWHFHLQVRATLNLYYKFA